MIRIGCFFVFKEYNNVEKKNSQANLYKKVCGEMNNNNQRVKT